MPQSTIRNSQPLKSDMVESDRVLPFHGISSVGFVCCLATMASSKRHLGGITEVDSRKLCLNTLGSLIEATGMSSWKLRMDPHVRLYAADGVCIMVSQGLEIEIGILEGSVLDSSAWVAACQAEGACKSAKLILGQMKLEANMKVHCRVTRCK